MITRKLPTSLFFLSGFTRLLYLAILNLYVFFRKIVCDTSHDPRERIIDSETKYELQISNTRHHTYTKLWKHRQEIYRRWKNDSKLQKKQGKSCLQVTK
ncbi:uncharacterized protein HD556DRAFT_1072415 [Suillus plorans]|uniref:Uncharacterized protein n=1 Tax=Suillus plorans TaxID=116603 RepID=A0A9P7ADA3_9AGAM|nr:uncharacterized protein HD556DRAFT_1072415 [Suillus plorans]KAG1786024.1 hypothetical protein HD556DRAFT_1072415 [Suillus plorans]